MWPGARVRVQFESGTLVPTTTYDDLVWFVGSWLVGWSVSAALVMHEDLRYVVIFLTLLCIYIFIVCVIVKHCINNSSRKKLHLLAGVATGCGLSRI